MIVDPILLTLAGALFFSAGMVAGAWWVQRPARRTERELDHVSFQECVCDTCGMTFMEPLGSKATLCRTCMRKYVERIEKGEL